MAQPTPEIGQYRPATRLKEGWQIRVLPNDGDGPAQWVEVAHVLRILAPFKIVQITLADGTNWAGAAGADVFCRTAAEIALAAKSTVPQEV